MRETKLPLVALAAEMSIQKVRLDFDPWRIFMPVLGVPTTPVFAQLQRYSPAPSFHKMSGRGRG